MNWLRYNWIGLVLMLSTFTLLYTLFFSEPEEKLGEKSAAMVTWKQARTQKAWKNWTDYWSMNKLKDAWSHGKPEDYIYYIKDPRTDLCFAVATPLGDGGFMASVPCDKVKHLWVNPGFKQPGRMK